MDDSIVEVDPWQQRSADPTAGGAHYPALVDAMRRLQDAIAMAAPTGESLESLSGRLDDLAAEVEKYRVDEWQRYAGRRRDLPGRGHPLLLPVIFDHTSPRGVRGRVTFGQYYLGGNNAAHGGTVTLLFDEVLGILANGDDPRPPRRTAYLTVNYRRITPVGVELRVEASVDRTEGRKLWATGRLYHDDQLVADAEGLFVRLRPRQP